MLSTDKISNAFKAICEEAERIQNQDLPESAKKGLSTIISIAKHQNDIRHSPEGSCAAHENDPPYKHGA